VLVNSSELISAHTQFEQAYAAQIVDDNNDMGAMFAAVHPYVDFDDDEMGGVLDMGQLKKSVLAVPITADFSDEEPEVYAMARANPNAFDGVASEPSKRKREKGICGCCAWLCCTHMWFYILCCLCCAIILAAAIIVVLIFFGGIIKHFHYPDTLGKRFVYQPRTRGHFISGKL
jgi:hypothetical protein